MKMIKISEGWGPENRGTMCTSFPVQCNEESLLEMTRMRTKKMMAIDTKETNVAGPKPEVHEFKSILKLFRAWPWWWWSELVMGCGNGAGFSVGTAAARVAKKQDITSTFIFFAKDLDG